jgi:hypothetical protein
LAGAWREVSPDPVAPLTPKEIIREMIKPRTYNWQQYAEDMRERDDGELPERFEDFNLTNKPTLRMD